MDYTPSRLDLYYESILIMLIGHLTTTGLTQGSTWDILLLLNKSITPSLKRINSIIPLYPQTLNCILFLDLYTFCHSGEIQANQHTCHLHREELGFPCPLDMWIKLLVSLKEDSQSFLGHIYMSFNGFPFRNREECKSLIIEQRPPKLLTSKIWQNI